MSGPPYRCHTCGATFKAWAPAERHADAEHHHRIALVLDQPIEARETEHTHGQ